MDRMTGLEVFARVVQLGTLSGAARALGMSQTMATKHVAAIEERVGVKLLHRTTRKITPTEAGRRYLENAERILAEFAEAEAEATAERVEVSGTLRVNAPVSFGVRQIAPLLAEFSSPHPGLSIDLGLNDRQVDLIEEGWDVTVRIGRIVDESLVARQLAACRLVVTAAPAYLLRCGTPRTLADLARHECLGYTLSEALGPRHWRFGATGDVRVAVRGTFQANNGDALLAAALAGAGLIYAPTFIVADDLRAGRLRSIALDHPVFELPGVFAVHAAGRRVPAKVRAFVGFLTHRFAGTPPWDHGLDEDAAET